MTEDRRKNLLGRKRWRDMGEEERRQLRRETIGKAAAIGLAKGCLMAAREVRRGRTFQEIGERYGKPVDRRLFFETYLNEAAEWRRYAAQEAIKP